ncbi:MAG: hypothetical protein KDD83_13290 [Caldilineaceae bacterium]|nr:hypothetical protein [Caldilineaceae bacterium]
MEKVGENGFHAAAADDRTRNLALLQPRDSFARRHLGPRPADIPAMLETVGVGSLDALIDKTVPASIRLARPLNLPPARGESAVLAELAELAAQNQVYRSFIGTGYYDTLTPPVILRNTKENPCWYTPYTP